MYKHPPHQSAVGPASPMRSLKTSVFFISFPKIVWLNLTPIDALTESPMIGTLRIIPPMIPTRPCAAGSAGHPFIRGIPHPQMKTQIECPKCGSYNTVSDRKTTILVGLAMVILGGLFSFLVFPLFFAAIGILLLIVGTLSKAKKMQCKQCKYTWKLA